MQFSNVLVKNTTAATTTAMVLLKILMRRKGRLKYLCCYGRTITMNICFHNSTKVFCDLQYYHL
jgi:hypothetical protein